MVAQVAMDREAALAGARVTVSNIVEDNSLKSLSTQQAASLSQADWQTKRSPLLIAMRTALVISAATLPQLMVQGRVLLTEIGRKYPEVGLAHESTST